MKFGTDAQKRSGCAAGPGKLLGCFALSEPEAGSDAAAQKTTATSRRRRLGHHRRQELDHQRPGRRRGVLFTMNDRAAGHKGITAFILPMDAGRARGPPDDKLGIRGSPSRARSSSTTSAPADHVLGEVGGGFKVAMSTLDGGRIGIAAQALGIARAASRTAWPTPRPARPSASRSAEHQAIQWKLADMATEIDAARLLTCAPRT
jgi:butyryl-CoA dehydrogenase